MTYRLARLDEIEVVNDGRCPWRPIRHHLGITAFGVNAWTGVSAGDRIVNEHDEADEDEELYVVLNGRARFEIDGEKVDAPTGSLVFVPPGVKRTAFAEEAETTVLAIGATPGKPYEAVGWEIWMPLNELAVPRQPPTRRPPPERGHRIVLRPRDDEDGAVVVAVRQCLDEELEPGGEGERLVGLVAPEGNQVFLLRQPREHVPVGDLSHRHVGDQRPAVRARDPDRERRRAHERLAALRVGESGR
jgi:hypothetical protein